MSHPSTGSPVGPAIQPTAPPGVLTVGELFPSTFKTLRAGLGVFVALVLAPILLSIVAVGAFVGFILVAVVRAQVATPDPSAIVGSVIGAAIVLYAAIMVIVLIQYVMLGRTVVGAIDLGSGRIRPTWANLRERTPGLLFRSFLLMLMVMGLVLLAYVLVIALAVGVAASSFSDGGPNFGGVIGLVLLLPVLAIVGIWLSVRLLYTLHAMAEEGRGPWEAITRSWQLTRGVFWRTLGQYLVVAIVVGVATSIPSLLTLRVDESTMSGAQAVLMLISGALSLAIGVLALPFQYIWTGLMFLSRRREVEGVGAGVQYPPQPGNPYGPPPTRPDDPWSSPQG